MALLNSSDNKKLNMLALAFQISEQITNTYSQDGKNDVSINIRFIDNVDEAKDYEHLTQVVSSKVLGEDVVAKAPFVGDDKGGLRIYLNEKFVGDVISGKDKRTVGHEMGHTGFLLHPEDPDSGSQQLPIKSNERNTMFQRGTLENYYQQNGLTLDVGKANKITDAQMMLLYSNYKGGKLNHSNGSGKYAGISTGQLITNYEDYYGKKITRFLQEIFW